MKRAGDRTWFVVCLVCVTGWLSPASADTPSPAPAETKPPANWVDDSHEYLCQSVVESAEWFDSFFGDERIEEEALGHRVRMRLGLRYEEGGELKPRLGFSAKLVLPNLDDRVQIVIDSLAQEDEPILGRDRIEQSFENADDNIDIAAATRVRLHQDEKTPIDLDVGLKLHSGDVEPFVKLRGRTLVIRDWLAFRWTQFGFYQSGDGFGERSRFDLDVARSEKQLLRGSTEVTWSEVSRGVDLSGQISYFRYKEKEQGAAGVGVFVDGQSDPETVEDYGVFLKLRRSIYRDWLYVELEPELHFPKIDDYDPAPRVTLRFEVIYGG
jgi:hypothetical protein